VALIDNRVKSPHLSDPTEGTKTKIHAVRALPLIALAAFFALVALLYAVSFHTIVGDSDGATVILEGQSMTSGHLALHGWALSFDSFWTVDALFYMMIEFITGAREFLLYLVPALIAGLVVVVGAWLARDGRRGAAGVFASVTVVALIGLPSHVLSMFFLRGPLHVGTALWCLIAFAGLRSGRLGWGWIVAVTFFAVGTLGDLQMVALGIAPAGFAGLVAMLRTRNWQSGAPTASAAVAGLVGAGALREIASVIGTFSVATSHPTASASEMFTNVRRIPTWGAHMLGIGDGGLPGGAVPGPLQALHIFGVLAVAAGVSVAAVSLVRGATMGRPSPPTSIENWRLDDLLVIAFVADLGVFAVLTTSNDPEFMRYLTAAIIFGAVLTGRLTGRLAASTNSTRLLKIGGALGLLVTGAFAAALGFSVTAPAPNRTFAALGQFLEAHHLRSGIGDYWSASITTVATRGSVTLRPVITNPGGEIVRYERQSTSNWYVKQTFGFLVYDTARPWGGVDSATAAATFGPISHTYPVGSYRVLVWNHPLSVSPVGFSPVIQDSTGNRPTPALDRGTTDRSGPKLEDHLVEISPGSVFTASTCTFLITRRAPHIPPWGGKGWCDEAPQQFEPR